MTTTANGLAVRCEELVHIYRTGETDVVAVRGVDLLVAPGERVALLGPSGSGKSTLLAMLGGLVSPSAGRVWVGDDEIGGMSERERLRLRANRVGLVLQGAARNLLQYATPSQNVVFAQRSAPRDARSRLLPPHELLGALGLGAIADSPVPGLSGGEQQRVALAVAVANAPGLLLADEPTSQLDHPARDSVLDLLDTVNDQFGTTVVIVTHDPEVGARLGRTVTMRYGRVGQEGHQGEQFAVVGKDGSVHLPDEVVAEWPPGTQVVVERDGDELRLRRRQT
ncbi:MAG TPA: ATP-binding cassette domain-containing protein [Candidatus Nanopelagicales bacterium]|nr:ATP-binding cassette domain-containing protein [Candidatus Nanopelagicales bacterium]